MQRLRLPQQYINWISLNRNICVDTTSGILNHSTSNGIPQGDVLSPLVFLIYTSILHECELDDALLFQFADDLCILAWGVGEIETNQVLQRAFNEIVAIIDDVGRHGYQS